MDDCPIPDKIHFSVDDECLTLTTQHTQKGMRLFRSTSLHEAGPCHDTNVDIPIEEFYLWLTSWGIFDIVAQSDTAFNRLYYYWVEHYDTPNLIPPPEYCIPLSYTH